MAVPAETPVMTPELLMVATAVLELVQVPPEEGLAAMGEPTQIRLEGKVTVGIVNTEAVTAVLVAVVHPLEVAST